jgi:hypothetical protein
VTELCGVWLRGGDLNPRPLGYEPVFARLLTTARAAPSQLFQGNRTTGDNPAQLQTAPDCPRFVPARVHGTGDCRICADADADAEAERQDNE